MKIHHLSCGTMCPHGGRLVSGHGGVLENAEIICHCLLIEGSEGLILVDTGIGVEDCAAIRKRLGVAFKVILRAVGNVEEAAINRVRDLGFDPADVRHIVPTHLDPDHAGGLPDFPGAEVQVFAAELASAMNPKIDERLRYRKPHFAHGPKWNEHSAGGDSWFGFESVRAVPGKDEILLIPLPGHSRGHCGVALREGNGWLLHAGDAYFHHAEMERPPHVPPALAAFENVTGAQRKKRLQNQERLRELKHSHGDEIRIFSAHDPVELEQLRR